MTVSKTDAGNTDLLLADLIDEIMSQQRRGEPVSLDAYASKYPDHVQHLQELLPALQALADLSQSAGQDGGSKIGPPRDRAAPQAAESISGTLDDFRILREVGRGGMGVVYEAQQISLRRRVALKVLPFAAMLDRRQLRRFENEAQAAAALEHPNIVNILSVGCDRGVHYYAMQFIEGRTLAQVIDELRASSFFPCAGEGPGVRGSEPTESFATSPASPSPSLPLSRSSPAPDTEPDALAAVSTKGPERTSEFFRSAAQLGVRAAEALEHAHQMGVVHRDIKPSNLMVDDRGHLWITDFGLAQIVNPSPFGGEGRGEGAALTMTGDIVGTLRYMSPEQAQGKRSEMNHRTDIYSLGVTLYELLTLQPAFAGDNREMLVRRLLEDDPPRPRIVSRAIPRDLETIVLKGTAKEPQQRYATAQEMADDLKRFLADEPIQAKRAGPVVRLKKCAKRHKAVTAVVTAALLAAAIFATVTAVQAYQRDARLTVTATEGLADVRVAMAQKEFAQAQRRATELQAELAAAPKVQAQFAPELEDLLHQAEARLRLQRFEKLAEQARFSANRLGFQWDVRDPADARRRCQEALAVFHVLDNDRWLHDLEQLPLERAEVTHIKQSLAETLFLLAIVEGGDADASGKRRAIDLLSQVETLVPNLRALYEYRSRYRTILGEHEAARRDLQRADALQSNTWLDHFFRAQDLAGANRRDAAREIEEALTFRPDDYWSWCRWGDLQEEADRARWGLTVCIRLRPEEPMAWVRRGFVWPASGDLTGNVADFTRALELTSEPEIRLQAYIHRARMQRHLGQAEAGVADCDSAIRLLPRSPEGYFFRAWCYRALGQAEKARADARRILELTDKGARGCPGRRMHAFEFLGQPQQAVEEAMALFQSESPQDKSHFLEGEGWDPHCAFVLAMLRWKLGQKEEARRWYDKGVKWMDEDKSRSRCEDETFVRFRDEAAKVLGIPVKPPEAKEKSEKTK